LKLTVRIAALLLLLSSAAPMASTEWPLETLPPVRNAPSALGANLPRPLADITMSPLEVARAELQQLRQLQIIVINRALEEDWSQRSRQWNHVVDEDRTAAYVDQLIVTIGPAKPLPPPAVPAATCSYADVNTAVTNAAEGGTVNIPAGDCTWTTQLTTTKGIWLNGAGEGVTIIRDNVTKDGSTSSSVIKLTVDSPKAFRISNMSIVGVATDPNVYNRGHIAISGTSKLFRIDHLTVTSPQTSLVRADGYLFGVIDHITMTGNRLLLQAGHSTWGGGVYGDGSWSAALSLGTVQAIYVEDSTLTASNNPFTTNFIDSLDGARLVVRNNAIVQGNVTSHGTDSGGRRRSVRSMEVYDNSFTFPVGMAVDFIVWMRGGTGVVFNNTYSVPGGLNHLVKGKNCRDAGAACGVGDTWEPFDTCDGTSPYDENQPGLSGYRCVDQPGAGTSRDLGGLEIPTAAWVENISDPFYVWGNTANTVSATAHVVANRDYFTGTARPGYTAYTYPHPCTLSAGLPSC
jgi:hypothetical protein